MELPIPLLAGSVGYALAELKAWPTGLDRPVRWAHGFYTTIAAVTLLGMALNYARSARSRPCSGAA